MTEHFRVDGKEKKNSKSDWGSKFIGRGGAEQRKKGQT